MTDKRLSGNLSPLFITTGLLAVSTVITVSYLAFSSSQNEVSLQQTTSNSSTVVSSTANVAPLPAELRNSLSKAELLALLPKPAAEDNIPVQNHQILTLWQANQESAQVEPGELRVEKVTANLEPLEVGRKVKFVTPHTGEPVSGEIAGQDLTNSGVTTYDLKLDNNVNLGCSLCLLATDLH